MILSNDRPYFDQVGEALCWHKVCLELKFIYSIETSNMSRFVIVTDMRDVKIIIESTTMRRSLRKIYGYNFSSNTCLIIIGQEHKRRRRVLHVTWYLDCSTPDAVMKELWNLIRLNHWKILPEKVMHFSFIWAIHRNRHMG